MQGEEARSRDPGRLTIGYLTPGVTGVGQARWQGVVDAARQRDLNLICFHGQYWHDSRSGGLANVMYELAGPENVDGIVLGNIFQEDQVSAEDFAALTGERLRMPVVSIRRTWPGIPFVPLSIDNYGGMREAMVHLVEHHGYRHIAFLRGPEGHPYADERYQAYLDALEEYGLPFDAALVTPSASWDETALVILLDERGLVPGTDFDALVAANDRKALAAVKTLQERGVRVPQDVAIVGFNDDLECRGSSPPLTSVSMPFYDQGWQAVEILVALLEGRPAPEDAALPAQLVVRQSCGCTSPAVAYAGPGPLSEREGNASAGRQELLATARHHLDGLGLAPDCREPLLAALFAAVDGAPPDAFLSELAETLRRMALEGEDVAAWQDVISVLRRELRLRLPDDEAAWRAEDLWQQARVMVAETGERVAVGRALQVQHEAATLHELGQALIATFDAAELMDVLARGLPRLGLPGCYLSLYEDPACPTAHARLAMAYDRGGRIELDRGDQPGPARRFPSAHLLPAGLLPRDRACSLLVEPLFFHRDHLGFVVFEVGPRQGSIYEVLRGEISSALQGASLIRKLEGRMTLIQTASEVARVASTILDSRELIQQAVDLIREHFDLYYVGLFLLRESAASQGLGGEWAYLAAGTGEAGREMKRQGHRLKTGSRSLVGDCIAQGQARILLDVRDQPGHFRNPFLPLTRSEMALPLTTRGRTIGALTVQSSVLGAFSPEDIAVFETMASQLATAIENVHLYEETQNALAELTAIQRRYIREGWSRYLGPERGQKGS